MRKNSDKNKKNQQKYKKNKKSIYYFIKKLYNDYAKRKFSNSYYNPKTNASDM